MANDEHLHKAFSFFDQNQSGYIEIEELRNALNDDDETTGEEVINAIMHDVDTDKVSICSLECLHLTSLFLMEDRYIICKDAFFNNIGES